MLAVILTLAMTASLAVGCGGGGESGSDGDTITLTFLDKHPEEEYKGYFEQAIADFEEQNPGVEIEYENISDQAIKEKLSVLAAGGDLPDIFFAWGGECLNRFTRAGRTLDLTPYMDEDPEWRDSFLPSFLSSSVYEGKNYAVPYRSAVLYMLYNKQIFADNGLEVPTTWDEFIEVGKDVVETTGYPMLTQASTEPQILGVMMQSAGQSVFQEDGSVKIADNELLMQCIDIYNEMVDTGVMQVINSNDELVTGLTQGTIGGVLSGCWILASVQLADDQSGKWAVTNIPSLPGVEGATNYSNLGGSSWAISSNCRNPELAEEFFASTFGGSVELYETVFPSTGLIAPYIPAAESGIYDTEQEFFGGQKVYQDIADYAQLVPTVPYGQYTAEFNTALGVALTNIASGADVRQELQIAQETVDFAMEGNGDA